MMLASAVQAQTPCPAPTNADVTTWHYDNCRTGWQQHESILNTSNVNQATFGKVMEYDVDGSVYAQPLAVSNVSSSKCPPPQTTCNLVFVATEQDMLYAFDADYVPALGQNPAWLWRADLAGDANGVYLNCLNNFESPCGPGVVYPGVGVTGTPVIDESAHVLFVVSFVVLSPGGEQNFIHAIDYTNGAELTRVPYQVVATSPGTNNPQHCQTGSSGGTITYDASVHYQRPGLLLIKNGNTDEVFVGFTPVGEGENPNGWIMQFNFDTTQNTFTLEKTFVSTPLGTGGGPWMSSAGLAWDGNYIYTSVGNGTFDATTPGQDYGDSLLQLDPSTSQFRVNQYFTPADVFSFVGGSNEGVGRCPNDEDLGSGGVLLFPDQILSTHPNLLITADKESNFYVVDRTNLTGYNQTGDLIVQELQTPTPVQTNQGYWGSPAYWKWKPTQNAVWRAIYYSVDATTDGPNSPANRPDPIAMYVLDPGTVPGPLIPSSPSYYTDNAFCLHGGAPVVSSNVSSDYTGVAGTGIVWAYEANNQHSPTDCVGLWGPAILHAYDASNLGNHTSELYTSSGLTSVNAPTNFSTPMVFNGRVYMGTKNAKPPGTGPWIKGHVEVFGLCGQYVNPTCFSN